MGPSQTRSNRGKRAAQRAVATRLAVGPVGAVQAGPVPTVRIRRPSAYPRRSQRALKVDIKALMLAVVLHARYRLPTAQIRRLIDLNPVGLKNHIDHLVPLFGQFGHQLTPHGDKIRKIEHLLTEALPQPTAATRDVTT